MTAFMLVLVGAGAVALIGVTWVFFATIIFCKDESRRRKFEDAM